MQEFHPLQISGSIYPTKQKVVTPPTKSKVSCSNFYQKYSIHTLDIMA